MSLGFKHHEILDTIILFLFEPETRRHQAWIDRICKSNCEIKGPVAGYLYKGWYFRPSDLPAGKFVGKILAPSLFSEADAYLKDKEVIDFDKQIIKQCLSKLINRCYEWQDIRDVLPEVATLEPRSV